jgi:hypothetical protein
MAGINFLSRNLLKDAIISLDTGTENAQFPLSNLFNDATAVKFRSNENSVVILIDCLVTSQIDAVAIHGDTNADLGLTSASFKTSLTTDFSSSPAHNIPLNALERLGFTFIEPVAHRYVELTLVGGGSFCEVSNVFIGERVNLPQQNLSISSFGYGLSDQSTASRNRYGQVFVDKRNKIKSLGGDLQHCLKSEQAELDAIWSRHGESLPLWVIVDQDGVATEGGPEALTIYGYLDKTPQWKSGGGQTWNTSISLTQAG